MKKNILAKNLSETYPEGNAYSGVLFDDPTLNYIIGIHYEENEEDASVDVNYGDQDMPDIGVTLEAVEHAIKVLTRLKKRMKSNA